MSYCESLDNGLFMDNNKPPLILAPRGLVSHSRKSVNSKKHCCCRIEIGCSLSATADGDDDGDDDGGDDVDGDYDDGGVQLTLAAALPLPGTRSRRQIEGRPRGFHREW